MRKGVDLVRLFNETDSARSFNIIDDILVEDTLRDAETQGTLHKIRLTLDKAYSGKSMNDDDPAYNFDYENMEYAESTEDGYVGINLTPLG